MKATTRKRLYIVSVICLVMSAIFYHGGSVSSDEVTQEISDDIEPVMALVLEKNESDSYSGYSMHHRYYIKYLTEDGKKIELRVHESLYDEATIGEYEIIYKYNYTYGETERAVISAESGFGFYFGGSVLFLIFAFMFFCIAFGNRKKRKRKRIVYE